jgi:hypothetical protein
MKTLSLFALATLGDVTQIKMILFVSNCQGKKGEHFYGAKLMTVLPTNFANVYQRGARYLTGDNEEVVWVKFSTLSQAVLLDNTINVQHAYGHFLICKLGPGFILLAEVCP